MATQQELVDELKAKLIDESLNDEEAVDLTRRILDHEKPVRNESGATRGLLGILNWASRCRRQRAYRRKSRGFTGIVIVSEGDSWFQYPKFLTDIIDWLQANKDYNIYSLGFGGDWLANILVKREYEKVLEKEKPQVFLVSGGGNDLVDHSRLASLVHEQSPERDKDPKTYRNDAYLCLMRLFRWQYRRLYERIGKAHPGLYIISHGYDFAIPSSRWGTGPIQILTNIVVNGKWLKRPLESRGITDPEAQEGVIRFMIDDFNQMLLELADEFPNVHHIDSRGKVGRDEWYNELHPNREGFKKITRQYEELIDQIGFHAGGSTVPERSLNAAPKRTPDQRKARVRRERRIIVAASLCLLLFLPFWAFFRLFYCWGESCAGWQCAFCDFHWVITVLILVFMVGLVLMAYELTQVSQESGQDVPKNIDDYWVPGAKRAIAGGAVVAKGAKAVADRAGKVPGAATILSAARTAKSIPGANKVGAGIKSVSSGLRQIQQTGKRFEHGRQLVVDDRPAIGTFLCAVAALAIALFMVFGPFDSVFFP